MQWPIVAFVNTPLATTPPDLVPSADVCRAVGIHRSTLTRWVKAGKATPAVKFDGLTGAYLFARDEVDRLAGRAVTQDQA